MPQENRTYIAIDLKSFYASVECVDRGLDPLTTNLVVADQSRTEKTICLAVSPSLKSYGIPGRARLFEVVQRMKEVNAERKLQAPGHIFTGSSYDDRELKCAPELSAGYITATPRMARYMEYSTKIYKIYLNYIAPEDIHVYSIDEVFMDATSYLSLYHVSIRQLAEMIIREVLRETGITATAGIGKNLYLCKIAMDIMAKRVTPDRDGVRIAELDEMNYRRLLWSHRPITDFWRVGNGYARKLEERGLFTMGDVARCSVGKATDFYNEDLLYKMFGVNAELLIDHAWGWEPCTMADIKAYKPNTSSLGSGQVLQHPYNYEKGKLIVCEMTDLLSLDLVEKGLVADQLVLTIGYDKESLSDPETKKRYKGPITLDHYGRRVPKHAHGTINLKQYTSSTEMLLEAITKLYERIVDRNLLIHRVTITANHVIRETETVKNMTYEQMDLFTDYAALQREQEKANTRLEREKKIQNTVLYIRKKYGKNAILRGMNLEEGAMTVERNRQIGGHKA